MRYQALLENDNSLLSLSLHVRNDKGLNASNNIVNSSEYCFNIME